jgi:hypothetical protein
MQKALNIKIFGQILQRENTLLVKLKELKKIKIQFGYKRLIILFIILMVKFLKLLNLVQILQIWSKNVKTKKE